MEGDVISRGKVSWCRVKFTLVVNSLQNTKTFSLELGLGLKSINQLTNQLTNCL